MLLKKIHFYLFLNSRLVTLKGRMTRQFFFTSSSSSSDLISSSLSHISSLRCCEPFVAVLPSHSFILKVGAHHPRAFILAKIANSEVLATKSTHNIYIFYECKTDPNSEVLAHPKKKGRGLVARIKKKKQI